MLWLVFFCIIKNKLNWAPIPITSLHSYYYFSSKHHPYSRIIFYELEQIVTIFLFLWKYVIIFCLFFKNINHNLFEAPKSLTQIIIWIPTFFSSASTELASILHFLYFYRPIHRTINRFEGMKFFYDSNSIKKYVFSVHKMNDEDDDGDCDNCLKQIEWFIIELLIFSSLSILDSCSLECLTNVKEELIEERA